MMRKISPYILLLTQPEKYGFQAADARPRLAPGGCTPEDRLNRVRYSGHGRAALVSKCKPRFAHASEDEGRKPEDGCKQIGL